MQCDQIFTLMFLENVVPVNYFFGFNFFNLDSQLVLIFSRNS